MTVKRAWLKPLGLPKPMMTMIIVLFAAVSTFCLLLVSVDSSQWFLAIPSFYFALVHLPDVVNGLKRWLAIVICLALGLAWLATCISLFRHDEAALADGVVVFGCFALLGNLLPFTPLGLKPMPLSGMTLGIGSVVAYWFSSPDIARWPGTTSEKVLSATIPALIAGGFGLFVGYAYQWSTRRRGISN